MASILLRKKIPLSSVIQTDTFILLRIEPVYEYIDGKRTDNLEGYRYEVVDTINLDRLRVKIKGQSAPLMSDEELQERREDGQKILVEFVNGTVMPYWNPNTKSVEDSFSADGIQLLETDGLD